MLILLLLFGHAVSQSNFYTASNIESLVYSYSAILTFQGTPLPTTIQNLNLTITAESSNTARIKITDLDNPRWEVPDVHIPPQSLVPLLSSNFSILLTESPFGLSIVRKSNNQVVFNIDPAVLFQYQNQDIIVTNSLPYSFFTYGLGERVSSFPLNPGIYTLFAKGLPGIYDDGVPPGKNIYSSHPMYLGVDIKGNSHGGFLLNSNAMDVSVNTSSVTFRTIGGIIDYFVFIGPRPEEVIKQYHKVIGTPGLVAYWALGYHQSRWGYNNLSDLQTVVTNFNKYQVPLDVLWTDIDYMVNYEDFTLDPTRYNYAEFSKFIDSLHEAGRKFVPITDAAIPQMDYPPYNDGLEMNLYIQSPFHPGSMVGLVWPGVAVYIDWFNPNATEYWHSQMAGLHSIMGFDGFWVDMNDPSSFCDGECGYPPSELVQNLPYMPGQYTINNFTIDMAGMHCNGYIEFDVHNLYALKMAQASASYFEEVLNTRAFVLSRGSFPSHGRYAAKWTGDNFAQYDYMAWSIPGIFNFQMFGVPLIGADICGFKSNTTEELCCRWYQLGMMYPFSRNHNSNDTISQEPWAFGPLLLEVSNNAIRNKYSLINYYYTIMFFVSLEGGTAFRPTFFEYPNDYNLLSLHSQDNFMVGPALLVHPVLKSGVNYVNAYFPSDIWYNWYSGARVTTSFKKTVVLDAPLNGMINVHMRGGHIILKNDGFNTANTVEKLRLANLTMVIAIGGNGQASGDLVFDDGISVGTIQNENFTAIRYSYLESENSASLNSHIWKKNYFKAQGEWPFISAIVLYGCTSQVTSVFNGDLRLDYASTFNAKLQVAKVQVNGVVPDQVFSLTINFS